MDVDTKRLIMWWTSSPWPMNCVMFMFVRWTFCPLKPKYPTNINTSIHCDNRIHSETPRSVTGFQAFKTNVIQIPTFVCKTPAWSLHTWLFADDSFECWCTSHTHRPWYNVQREAADEPSNVKVQAYQYSCCTHVYWITTTPGSSSDETCPQP